MKKRLPLLAALVLLLPAAAWPQRPSLYLSLPRTQPGPYVVRTVPSARLSFGPGLGPPVVGPGMLGDPRASAEERAESGLETAMLAMAAVARFFPGAVPDAAARRWGVQGQGRTPPLTGIAAGPSSYAPYFMIGLRMRY